MLFADCSNEFWCIMLGYILLPNFELNNRNQHYLHRHDPNPAIAPNQQQSRQSRQNSNLHINCPDTGGAQTFHYTRGSECSLYESVFETTTNEMNKQTLIFQFNEQIIE